MTKRTLFKLLVGSLVLLLPLAGGCTKTSSRRGGTSTSGGTLVSKDAGAKEEEKRLERQRKALAKAEAKRRKEEEKRLKKLEKERRKEEARKKKEEEKQRKAEEKRLKELEKERRKEEARKKKEEEKRLKEEAKRRAKAVVKNPETPEGRAAEMIVRYYEFYFPVMLVFEENESCLRRAGVSKNDLCATLGNVGKAKITAIETFIGKAEPYGEKERTAVAAKIEGTVEVKGKKRKVSRHEIFYLDSDSQSREFADSHGVFRLTFRKEAAAAGR